MSTLISKILLYAWALFLIGAVLYVFVCGIDEILSAIQKRMPKLSNWPYRPDEKRGLRLAFGIFVIIMAMLGGIAIIDGIKA